MMLPWGNVREGIEREREHQMLTRCESQLERGLAKLMPAGKRSGHMG